MTEDFAHGFTLLGQHRDVLRKAAGLGVERAVGEGPRGPGKTRQDQLGFLTVIIAHGLRTNPLTQTLNNCLIWPAE